MNKKNHVSGQSMFEVVIALFIIAMVVVGIVSVSTFSLSNSLFSRNKTLAGKYSQEAIEWLRSQREQDSAAFVLNAQTPTYCLQTLAWSNSGVCGSSEVIGTSVFRREVNFTLDTSSGKNIIEADVKTYWDDSRGYHEAKSVTDFADVREK